MFLNEITVEGTLAADGTLELDRKPALPPGRVTIVLRSQAPGSSPNEDWFDCLQRLRTEREAAGYPFMNEDEVQEHLDWLREGDRIDDLLRLAERQSEQRESGC